MRWLKWFTFDQLFLEAECAQEKVEKRLVCFCCDCEQDVFVVERLFQRLDHRHPIDLALELLVMCYHRLAEILWGSLRIQKKLLDLPHTNFSTHVVAILHHLVRWEYFFDLLKLLLFNDDLILSWNHDRACESWFTLRLFQGNLLLFDLTLRVFKSLFHLFVLLEHISVLLLQFFNILAQFFIFCHLI